MREGHAFHCPECQARSPVGVRCDECGLAMIDELGNPAHPLPARRIQDLGGLPTTFGVLAAMFAASAGPLLGGWTAAAATAALACGGLLVDVLGWAIPRGAERLRRRRRARAYLAQVPEVQRIADARTGLAHVSGRVDVLGGSTFAACDQPGAERQSWRFVLSDGSGVAVVDDDYVEVWHPDRRQLGGVVADGETIEVVGHARLEPASEPDLAAGYRGAAVLTFVGTPEAPILLVRRPTPS